MFIFVTNYCSDMLRPQFLATVWELTNSSSYAEFVVNKAEEIDLYTSVSTPYSFSLNTECLRLNSATHFNRRIFSTTDVWTQNINSMPN